MIQNQTKKGELAINKLVVFALAILVLIVLSFIFSGQVRGFAERIGLITADIDAERSGAKCVQSLISQRQCYTQTCAAIQTQVRDGGDPGATYSVVPAPSGTWPDCDGTSGRGSYCCERIQ